MWWCVLRVVYDCFPVALSEEEVVAHDAVFELLECGAWEEDE